MSVDDRLVELETRIIFQEDALQSLNDVLVTQQAELESLHRQVLELHRRLNEQPSVALTDTPPPHY